MIEKLEISLRTPDDGTMPPRVDISLYFRSLRRGGAPMFDLGESFRYADRLLSGETLQFNQDMFYAIARDTMTYSKYPLYNEPATFRDVPLFLDIKIEYTKETLAQVEDQNRQERKIELLNDAVNGNAESAIEFCRKLKSGEISWGCPR